MTAAALSSLKQEISSLNLGDRTRGEILPPVLDFPCGETAKKSGANSEYGRNEKKDKTARDDTAGGDPAGATSGLSLPASTEAILRSAYSKAVENEHRHTELHIKVDQLMKKMEAVEQTLLTTQKMLEAANNRISQGEMTQGEIVWRLNDLNALLVHRGLVVYSKPFSSSPFGYRFCMRVNTVTPGGVDQHQYISLFLHLVPGEWDAILPWPFRGELTLAILEQGPVEAYNDSGKRHHVEERIRIPVSPGRKIPAAFSRPPCSVTRADKGYGFSQFVSVDLLRRSGRKYIQNNSLYLRAKVRPDFADPLSHLEDESGIKSAPLAKEVPRSEPLASGGNSPSPKTRLKGIAATFVHRTKSDSTRPDN
ncbi:unnamed protein product [Cyprideis torosa]|uniref:Uncharacterized protein n=1 Tax=Cyprideis torosa TaxID=163714 RepID=A0A7R8WMB6_9CRUS|nr:unnamed protein product [Cyprideis torosa]CAG0899100.1 unnamed protein product [Cyprideis torosa]